MRVRFYATLRDLVGVNATDLPLEGTTDIRHVLDRLMEAYPPLHDKLWDAEGDWSGFVTVLLNGRSIQWLQGLDTMVANGDAISLFPPVGGG